MFAATFAAAAIGFLACAVVFFTGFGLPLSAVVAPALIVPAVYLGVVVGTEVSRRTAVIAALVFELLSSAVLDKFWIFAGAVGAH